MYPPELKRNRFCFISNGLLFIISAFLVVNLSHAETTTPKLTVKAVVPPRLHLRVLYQLPEITITNLDIRRGHIDLPAASLLEVESNNPAGFLLAFQGSLGPFREVHIKGLDNPVQLDSGNAFILQPYTGNSKVTIELSYRGMLSENLNPGTYFWPFSISVQPVENQDYYRKKK